MLFRCFVGLYCPRRYWLFCMFSVPVCCVLCVIMSYCVLLYDTMIQSVLASRTWLLSTPFTYTAVCTWKPGRNSIQVGKTLAPFEVLKNSLFSHPQDELILGSIRDENLRELVEVPRRTGTYPEFASIYFTNQGDVRSNREWSETRGIYVLVLKLQADIFPVLSYMLPSACLSFPEGCNRTLTKPSSRRTCRICNMVLLPTWKTPSVTRSQRWHLHKGEHVPISV